MLELAGTHDPVWQSYGTTAALRLACNTVEITLNPQSSRASILPVKAPTLCWKAGLLSLMFRNFSWLGSLYILARYFCMVLKQVVTPALLSGCAFFNSTSFALSFSATADKEAARVNHADCWLHPHCQHCTPAQLCLMAQLH